MLLKQNCRSKIILNTLLKFEIVLIYKIFLNSPKGNEMTKPLTNNIERVIIFKPLTAFKNCLK